MTNFNRKGKSMNPSLVKHFICETKRTLAFLAQYGFTCDEKSIEITPLLIRMPYLGKNIAIILSYDDRDQTVDCAVAKICNGVIIRNKTEGGYWSPLYSHLINHQGFRGCIGGRDRPNPNKIEDRLSLALDDYSKALQKHGQAILSDQKNALP